MSQLVPIIVLFIVALQIFFFIRNVLRMREYKEIFEEEHSWGIAHHPETEFVSGIYGKGNAVFESIKDSINKYLENNSGSVIDFSLLKDAVDRHCDSVENDINTLTPVPLYCGLAGTMAGVIVGLGSLLATGSITELLSPEEVTAPGAVAFGRAAEGVNDLLAGVAWAMLASICGILLTTIASLLFKRYKLQGEYGKNTFLAWLQSRLLPELPSDTSDALTRLVKNLNTFNNTFAANTSSLRGALREVNESYRIQGDIIKAVHDMDVMKMAKANVQVLQELKECTDKLEQFNQYLSSIHGYTAAIHRFTTQFEQESERLHVLEEIKLFFMRHKAEIAKDSADADVALRDALKTLKDTASSNTNEFHSTLVQQAEEFKKIIKEEKESFEAINKEIKAQFEVQLNRIPQLERQLADISSIPEKLDKLIDRMERTNNSLATRVNSTMTNTANELKTMSFHAETNSSHGTTMLPKWMKWTITISAILTALACLSNVAYNVWQSLTPQTPVTIVTEEADSLQTDTLQQDSLSQRSSQDSVPSVTVPFRIQNNQ